MLRKILMLICVIICLIFISKIIIDVVDEKEGTSFYNSTLPSHNKIDVKDLTKEYPNVKAYIKIDGTNIDYPVVQGEDNEYYLSHLPNDKKNQMGSIYLDYRNKNFSDDNTIIYGHNMQNDTMFGTLQDYKKQEYYDEHKIMYLFTPDKQYKIELFAGYTIPVESDIYDMAKLDQEDIEEAMRKSDFKSDVIVSAEDKIITLSTCAYEYEGARYIVMGMLHEVI